MDNKTERIVSLVSPEELERIQKAADEQERSLSSFVRLAALQLAGDGKRRRSNLKAQPA